MFLKNPLSVKRDYIHFGAKSEEKHKMFPGWNIEVFCEVLLCISIWYKEKLRLLLMFGGLMDITWINRLFDWETFFPPFAVIIGHLSIL